MLTLKECRKILEVNETELTDAEVLQMRDWLYHIAEIAIDAMEEKRAKQPIQIENKSK